MTETLRRFVVSDRFFGRYEMLMRDVVIPYQENILRDSIPGVPPSNAIKNFELAAEVVEKGRCSGKFVGMVFQDSDVAKWLEAAAYSMTAFPNPELESRCDKLIDLIGRSQFPDGYLNTYFTVKDPEKRWTNLEEAHELYCAGHMIEAGVAYAQCLGKTKLLEIARKTADHIYKRFITEKHSGYPGHPEIEMALMKLYRYTGNEKYKELAEHFINVRGVDSDYFIQESRRDNWTVWDNQPENKEYMQCQAPVRDLTEATGHAVRAVYLYTGMADVARGAKDEALTRACKALWRNITQKKMYVTGAIGSAYEGETFTKDYHLPNDTAYAETCAAIGLIFFARKMLDIEKRGNYADVMERALYNCVLAGMSLDGTRYFYVNPLEVVPGISGEAISQKHCLPVRPEWFPCACCPPNVARLITSIGEYAWSVEGKTVYSHLFIAGDLDLSDLCGGRISVRTDYPYSGTADYVFYPDGASMDAILAIRVPEWSESVSLYKNGEPAVYAEERGYAYLRGPFSRGDTVSLRLDMRIRKIYANGNISADSAKVAFSRGPLIYCMEGADNSGDVLNLALEPQARPEALEYRPDKLFGIVEIEVDGCRLSQSDSLYSYESPKRSKQKLRLIPYYAWGNRGANQMRVWIPQVAP